MPISIACDWWRQTAIRQWLFLQSVLEFMVTLVQAAAEIAVKTVSEFITRHALPEQVYFVCYDEENAHLYERLLTQQGDE